MTHPLVCGGMNKSIISLEGSQAPSAHPSDRNSMKKKVQMKTLELFKD